MRLTVAKKLGLGFGVIITLMALSTFIAYDRIRALNGSVRIAVDGSLPSAVACQSLIAEVNSTIAALRGYIIFGGDPHDAERFKTLRAQAWVGVDRRLRDLTALSAAWEDPEARQRLTGLVPAVEEFRRTQQRVEDVAHTEGNRKASYAMQTEALPLVGTMTSALSEIGREESTLDATADRKALQRLVNSLELALAYTVSELRSQMLDGDPESETRLSQVWRAVQAAHAKLEAQQELLTGAQRANWQRYDDAYAQFEPLPARLVALRKAPDWNQANYTMENESVPRGRQINDALEQLSVALNESGLTHRAAITSNSRTAAATLIGGAIAAVVIAGAIAAGLSRRIVASIQAVAGGARQVADGDLAGADVTVRAQDEIAELASAFNQMRASLKDMTGQVRQATENVNSTAAEILASTQQQAAASKEQAATIQEITSTLEEINQSGGQIGERARQVSASVEASASATQRGIKATQDTSQTMEAIRDQVEEVAENVVSLSERTQTIGELIATVSEIAEQSNLLALNASIEAASAGEQGGRFSVVAHEMKNLADRAKDCTVQVRTILGEIQKGINTSVMLTEEAVKRVDGGKQQAHSTEDTIREVTETNDTSIQAFQQIVAGANQQQIGVAQVTQGMQDIRQAVKQTAASTSQLEKAAANMNALSQQLQRVVARYRV